MKLNRINKKIKRLIAKKDKLKDKIEDLKVKRYYIQMEIDLENLRKLKDLKNDV